MAHDASLMIAVGKNGGLVSIPRLMLYSDVVQREKKMGIYYEICKMMDISEDEREETEDTRRKPRIMRKNEACFAHATIN